MYLTLATSEAVADYIAALPFLGDVVDHISDDETIWVMPAIGPLQSIGAGKPYAVLQSTSLCALAFRYAYFCDDFLAAMQEAAELERRS